MASIKIYKSLQDLQYEHISLIQFFQFKDRILFNLQLINIRYQFGITKIMFRTFNSSSAIYKFANFNSQMKINNKIKGEQPKQIQRTNYGSLNEIVEEKKRMSIEAKKKYFDNLPAVEMRSFVNQHLCDVKLYMRHDDWKSQYIFALMNYQKLGFQRLSDYAQLKEGAKYFGISKLPESERWPLMKFSIPLREPSVLHGRNQIIKFLNENQFFKFQVDDDILSQTLQKYINENVVSSIQSLCWHPRLTFQQVFHTNITGYTKSSLNYRMLSIIYLNIIEISKQVAKNFMKILFNRQRYAHSKQNLQKSLREIASMLQGKQFIGGDKPSHLDFYLYAILSTKRLSNHFQKFLKNDVGTQFWSWMLRMRRLTQYDKERVTLY